MKSGGIHALKGFDYQATVILDLLFNHFDNHGSAARARPEGLDDLDLCWKEHSQDYRSYIQIKKPTEDANGNFKPSPWRLAEAVTDLFPNTISHLTGNTYEQVWILGDEVTEELKALISAGVSAPTTAPSAYFEAIHLLARNEASITEKVKLKEAKQKIERWRPPSSLAADPLQALRMLIDEFTQSAKNLGITDASIDEYRAAMARIHASLPNVLAKTTILSTFGSEQQVAARVQDQLEKRYQLPRAVVGDTLFRNLRGFINDISKQPGRTFDLIELELELRSVWPVMIPIKAPPSLDAHHVPRPDLIERITASRTGHVVEVVGISGSGKTSLAAEAITHIRSVAPDRAVYYAEVRSNEHFRNVLAGIAFHLRRAGIVEPFGLAVRPSVADEQVIRDLALALGAIVRPTLLLVDLVEGTCSSSFAHDLATFVRALTSPIFQLVVFGKEQALRDLSPFEREEHGVAHLDVRGFHFAEFVTLVSQQHPGADREVLWDVFQRVTAGRSAGLFAKLAQSLARVESLEKMRESAAKPADSILEYAEQQRFTRISESARRAAEKLVCFALPFQRKDAEEIFSEENVGLAIRELLALGLLRPLDEDRLEMHETVRAGLEQNIAPDTRRRAHEALAAWYGERELITAEILHLDKSGKQKDAHRRARETFLDGKHWEALAAYVADHHLVTGLEVISFLTRSEPIKNAYLLPRILRQIGDSSTTEELLKQIYEQATRFDKDYSWAWKMVEAVLESDSTKLYELVLFALKSQERIDSSNTRLDYLRTGTRRIGVHIDVRILELFHRQPQEVQRDMLSLLLLDRRREVFTVVFQFLTTYQAPVNWQRHGEIISGKMSIQLERPADIIEFLAAIPTVELSQMLTAKSAMLGPLTSFVWSQRKLLQAQCVKVLKNAAEEETVLKNSIRVLVFLAEATLLALCEPLTLRKDDLGLLAKFVPALAPWTADRKFYEERLLDVCCDLEERTMALAVLTSIGADFGSLLRKLKETDREHMKLWSWLFLMKCLFHPFEEAIPLLEERLSTCNEKEAQILAGLLMPLGGLPTVKATAMLSNALSHADPRVRFVAGQTLAYRRAPRALSSLIEGCARENDPIIAQTMAISAIASRPRSSTHFAALWSKLTPPELWRDILTMRLRESSASSQIIATALDSTKHWQLRRTAILAAGRLPYDVALEKIATTILQERSPLGIDQNHNLLAHSTIAFFTLEEAPAMKIRFVASKDRFVSVFGSIFEDSWKENFSRDEGLPSGLAAATWLFDRFVHHGWPGNSHAPNLVISELHTPILHSAVLRSLRLCGRADLIEKQIPSAYHIWFFMKCVIERAKAESFDPQLVDRFRLLAAASPWNDSPFLKNTLKNLSEHASNKAKADVLKHIAQEASALTVSYVRYEEVVRALTDANSDFNPKPPLVLEGLDAQQCEHLVQLLDPSNDYRYVVATSNAAVHFTRSGYMIGGGYADQISNRRDLRVALRPAVVAANKFDLTIPWHRDLLGGDRHSTYAHEFIDCLVACDNSTRFYDELAQNEDLLMPYIGDITRIGPILKYIDTRIVALLNRHARAGTDKFFEALCMLAHRINAPEIDSILSDLFHRWTQRFEPRSPEVQHSDNNPLWRAFSYLAGHPRFELIQGWEIRVSAVLHANISWFHKNNLVRVFERSPRAYSQIESMLFKTADFEHYFESEVDRLDEAADRLFLQILEED